MSDSKFNYEDISFDKKKKIRDILLEVIISLLICSVFSLSVGLIEVYGNSLDYQANKLRIYGDSFFVSGITTTLFYCLVLLSNAGAFDMLVYGVRKFFNYIFRRKLDESKLPKTYYDYVILKRGKKKNKRLYFLFISLIFLLVGIVVSLLAL